MGKRAAALCEALEEDILTGRVQPGDHLEEQVLAKRFGVSRTPIREALLHLAASGLVDNIPRRGAFVAQIGPVRLIEMFEVMAGLEAICARLATRRMTQKALSAIEAAHNACAEAAQTADTDSYYYLNESFHEQIRAASGNSFLIEQAAQLHKRLRPYRRLQLRATNRVRNSLSEHEAVLNAIKADDPEAAATAMRDHIAIQGERFTDLISSLSQSAA